MCDESDNTTERALAAWFTQRIFQAVRWLKQECLSCEFRKAQSEAQAESLKYSYSGTECSSSLQI